MNTPKLIIPPSLLINANSSVSPHKKHGKKSNYDFALLSTPSVPPSPPTSTPSTGWPPYDSLVDEPHPHGGSTELIISAYF